MNFRTHVGSTWAFLAAAFLSLFIVTGAAAQTPPGMTEVSGLYVNADAGIEITFPDGWSGAEVPVSGQLLVLTAPGGISDEVTKSITLTTTDQTDRDPNNPGSFNNDLLTCNAPSVESRTVAGVQGIEMLIECPATEQMFKMVIVGTADEWIIVSYMSASSEFDSDVGKFDASVDSLKVEGAIDSEGTGGMDDGATIDLTAVTRTVVIAGANVDVNIRTNSTIGQLDLDVENKQVSFTVDGQTGTTGTTEIAIGKMLEGPYTVTVDGQATTDFEVTNEGSAEAVMTISYTHSVHDVAITGTSVVPEFPVVVIGALAAIVGVVAILGRTRLVRGQL